MDVQGSQNGSTWTKANGKGYQHGFNLRSELQEKGAITLPDILEHTAQRYKESKCMGTRKLIRRDFLLKEGSKKLEKLTLGDYEWKKYDEVYQDVLKVAAGIQSIAPEPDRKVAILAETRADWFISCVGVLKSGKTVVTLYTNMSDAFLCHGLEETESEVLITSHECLSRVISVLPMCNHKIKTIIILEDQLEGTGNVTDLPISIKVYSFSDFKSLGSSETPMPKLSLDDVAIIMYTSGSTGRPKGVEITHSNIFYSLTDYAIQANLKSGDRYIAYLPLAHIMELLTEFAQITFGLTIAYSSPFTLTNNSPKIAHGTLGDARIVKPTSMNAVPLILDRIIKAASLNVEKQGKITSKLFKQALNYKKGQISAKRSFASAVLDRLIFQKVQAELGGCLQMLVVGGAPLSPHCHSSIQAMFGCTIQIGYGCTETTASITSMDDSDFRSGHAGPPNSSISVTLEDWEEGDYRISDQPHPRGEIIVGGPSVAKGYFKLDEETKESFFDRDGVRWFRTGDIGSFDESGVLQVIDRKKDLVKLKHGEYISLGNTESKLKTSPLVENICVFADSSKDFTIAIVHPALEPFQKIGNGNDKDANGNGKDLDGMCSDEKCVANLLEHLQNHGRKHGLTKWEIPKHVHLTSVAWTPDNGMVTSGMKLRRKAIQKEFTEQINSFFQVENC